MHYSYCYRILRSNENNYRSLKRMLMNLAFNIFVISFLVLTSWWGGTKTQNDALRMGNTIETENARNNL